MAENTINVKVKQRTDTESNWASKNPVLLKGEMAISSDKNNKYKIGDGTSAWSALSYAKAELTKSDVTTALGYTPPTTNTTYNDVTQSAHGLMTAADKKKLDGIASGATKVTDSTVAGWGYKKTDTNTWRPVETTLTNENLNNVTTAGFYSAGGGNTVVNKPNGVDHFGMIVVHRASGSYYVQIIFNDSASWRRFCINGTWGSWSQDKLTDTNTWRPQPDWSATSGDAVIKNKPSLATVATSGSYTDLSNKPTIPTVGNGTITITQNGTSKGTFTTNQSGNTTIALTDNNTTYSTGTASTSGLTKLYTGTGTATDGTMTQAAIKSALDGKAPSSHTHNYAGSSSAGGVANSATKLETARSIGLGGYSTGSANFNGSGNITIDNWGYGCNKYVTTDSVSLPYFRIAYCEDKISYSDRSMVFVIDSGYCGGGFGIVKVAFRNNNISVKNQSECEVKWLVRQGFAANQLLVKGNAPAGGIQYADLYFKATSTYQAITVTTLSMGGRGSKSRVWTFDSGTCRANPDIRTYTYTTEGSDSGSVGYASSSYSATSATTASKLSTSTAGTATKPVYFTNGVPTACTYTLEKSVPSNAVFTDTNTKVTSVDNHYAPSGGTTKNASGGTATNATGSGNAVQVVTGVTVDAAGHVTGITSKGVYSTDTNTTYKDATTSAHGLMTAAMVTKLNGIATNANNYSHPTTAGNKHIPAGGSTGQTLKWSADGTCTWETPHRVAIAAKEPSGQLTNDEWLLEYT